MWFAQLLMENGIMDWHKADVNAAPEKHGLHVYPYQDNVVVLISTG